MKTLSLLTFLVFLSGCFLTPESGTSPQVGEGKIAGGVNMVDVQGHITNLEEGVESYVKAGVYSATAQVQHLGMIRNRNLTSAADGTRELKCDVARGSVQGATRATEYLSMGKAYFNDRQMTEKENHIYDLAIAKDFPSGYFRFSAEGAGAIPAMVAAISMPEAIKDAKADSANMETEGPVISKVGGLKFEWSTPKDLNSGNWVVVSVLSVGTTEAVQVECYRQESELWAGGGATLSIEIPTNYLKELPLSDQVDLQLIRIHQMKESDATPVAKDVLRQGLRIVATRGIIQP